MQKLGNQQTRKPQFQVSRKPRPLIEDRRDPRSVFVDGAWQESSHRAGMGWIIKGINGACISQGSLNRPCVSSALVAEALALTRCVCCGTQSSPNLLGLLCPHQHPNLRVGSERDCRHSSRH